MKKVHLDFGHGGKDPGAIGNGLKEKDITLQIGLKVADFLKEHGVQVYYSRKTDIFVELSDRADLANREDTDIFVSIHCNGFGKPSARGFEVYSHYSSDYGTVLAKCIHDSVILNKELYTDDRGIKKANFAVLRETKMVAALIEMAFITNPEDAKILTAKQDEMAKAIAVGILNYLGVGYKEEETPKGIVDYKKVGNLQVLITPPTNTYMGVLYGKTLKQAGIWGINGTWQDNDNAKDPASIWGLAVNNSKPIGPNSHTNSPKGYKRGTIIFHKGGGIEVARVNSIKEFTGPVQWAVGGGMLFPDYDPEKEGFVGKFSDVLRDTRHTGVGYRDGKIYQFVHSGCTLAKFAEIVKNILDLEAAVFLDGGASTQMNYRGKGIYSGRKLSHGMFLIEG